MKTQDVITFFGSRKAVAEKLGICRSAVSHWGEVVPHQRQFEIQLISRGKLKAIKKAALRIL